MSDKPNVLVLGGLGFIGRNFVQYLHEKGLAGHIRIADKQIPELAGLSEKQTEFIKNTEGISFKQSNLSRPSTIDKIFEGFKFDYVFNLAGETKYSQTEEVYNENIIELTKNVAQASAKHGVKRFIEVSTAQVYDANKKPSSESDKIKPWNKLAKAKLAAEEELKKVEGLEHIIVRPAVVYGPGDILGLTPRLICGAVYKHTGEKMDFLWDKDLQMNTVHVNDVCKALWHLTTNGEAGAVYNLADSGKTDQGKIASFLEEIFGIKTNFMGYMKSKAATSLSMRSVVEHANENHLGPWSEMLKTNNISNSPLTPFLDEELLYNNPISVDGSKITSTGFSYDHPEVTKESLQETIKYFVDLGHFPPNLC